MSVNTPPSLLYVTTVPDFLRAFLRPYARHFRSMGWRVAAATSRAGFSEEDIGDRAWDSATLEDFPERYGLGLRRGMAGALGVLGAASKLRSLSRAERFDIVHVHTPVAGVAARLGVRGGRLGGESAVIYTAHGFHFHQGRHWLGNFPWTTVERWCARRTDWIVVMNEDDERAVASWRELPAGRVVRMPGIGIDAEAYRTASRAKRERSAYRAHAVPENHRILLMIAELRPRKRVSDALEAMALLGDFPVTLCVAGQGPLRAQLESEAERLGVGNRVRWLGYRTDVPALLAGADALALCSEREGLPRAVLESMAAGVPVVATDIRGTRDLLAPGGGLLYPRGDVGRLAHGIRRVLVDRDLTASLVQTAARGFERYELKNLLNLHERLYLQALAASRKGS